MPSPLSGRAGWHAQRRIRISRARRSAPRSAVAERRISARMVMTQSYTEPDANGKTEFHAKSAKHDWPVEPAHTAEMTRMSRRASGWAPVWVYVWVHIWTRAVLSSWPASGCGRISCLLRCCRCCRLRFQMYPWPWHPLRPARVLARHSPRCLRPVRRWHSASHPDPDVWS